MLWIAALGCASRQFPPNSGPLLPFFDAYSRNELVCTPAFVGNVFGFAVTAPAALALVLPVAPFSGKLAGGTAMTLSYAGALLGGAILGTPFLPPSFLLAEDPCVIGFRD